MLIRICSARPSRRHYESDVYVSSRPASSFKRPHASSSYSISSSARRSTLFGDVTAHPARPSHLEQPAERSVSVPKNETPCAALTLDIALPCVCSAGTATPPSAQPSSSNAATACAIRVSARSSNYLSLIRSNTCPHGAVPLIISRPSTLTCCSIPASRGNGSRSTGSTRVNIASRAPHVDAAAR
jgi:hypothetical protein